MTYDALFSCIRTFDNTNRRQRSTGLLREHKRAYLLNYLSPNSIRSILSYDLSYLSETRSQTSRRPGLRLFFCSKLVGNQVSDFFSAQNLSETRFPTFLFVENLPLDLSRHVGDQVSDFFSAQNLSETRFPTFFLLKTCRKPGFKQVLSKIGVMEFGKRHVCDFFVGDQVSDFFLLKTCRKPGFRLFSAQNLSETWF